MTDAQYDKQQMELLEEVKQLGQVSFVIPRCASCGEYKNLTFGYAGGNIVYYCQRHKEEEES